MTRWTAIGWWEIELRTIELKALAWWVLQSEKLTG
jgi:hypothetical protein